jgi:ZIP family zinc transporter
MASVSNALLARFGAGHRKRCGDCVQQPRESQQPGSGVAIALGNALDGLPEALVLTSCCPYAFLVVPPNCRR